MNKVNLQIPRCNCYSSSCLQSDHCYLLTVQFVDYCLKPHPPDRVAKGNNRVATINSVV